jgi:hypothetical protein
MGERPDIRIPVNNPRALQGLVTREFQSYIVLKAYVTSETRAEMDQCEANMNNLLDHYPGGVRRPEVSVEQANESIARLGRLSSAT